MSDHERVVVLALGAHRVADHLTGTPHLDQGVSIRVVRRNALDIDRGAGIDHRLEVLAQAVPVRFAVFVVYVALVPNAHVSTPLQRSATGPRAKQKRPAVRKTNRPKALAYLRRSFKVNAIAMNV